MKTSVFPKVYTGIAIILIILIYSQIFRYSNAPAEASEELSISVSEKIIETLEKILKVDLPFNDTPERISATDGFVRKAAHFSEYALLGSVVYSIPICWRKNNKKGTILSFLFVVLLAAGDEFHQYFVPGRSCSFKDICIDSTGCLVGMLVIALLYALYSRQHAKVTETL